MPLDPEWLDSIGWSYGRHSCSVSVCPTRLRCSSPVARPVSAGRSITLCGSAWVDAGGRSDARSRLHRTTRRGQRRLPYQAEWAVGLHARQAVSSLPRSSCTCTSSSPTPVLSAVHGNAKSSTPYWGSPPTPRPLPDDLGSVLDAGLVRPGQAFNSRRWRQLGYLIEVFVALKQMSADDRRASAARSEEVR